MASLRFNFMAEPGQPMITLERTTAEWVRVCRTVDRVAHNFARVPRVRQASELKKVRTLRDDATRTGHHDTATYLQECIDDMTGAQS